MREHLKDRGHISLSDLALSNAIDLELSQDLAEGLWQEMPSDLKNVIAKLIHHTFEDWMFDPVLGKKFSVFSVKIKNQIWKKLDAQGNTDRDALEGLVSAPFKDIPSPIDLFLHMWRPHEKNSQRTGIILPLIMVRLILLSFELFRPEWRESVISASLFVARSELAMKGLQADKNSKLARSKLKQNRALIQYNEAKSELQKIEKGRNRQRIWVVANQLIQQKKSPRNIVALISKRLKENNELSLSQRSIRRYLQDHSSGHWVPKPKKK